MRRRLLVVAMSGAASVGAAGLALPRAARARTITLVGASQFGSDHPYSRTLQYFTGQVRRFYDQPVEFVIHGRSTLGLEKQYFEYMARGRAVDFAVVSPAHMATFSRLAPVMDAPFVFRDLAHWHRVLDRDLLAPLADDVVGRAGVRIVGFGGGGVRNLFAAQPVTTLGQARGLRVRVAAAPVWSRSFEAARMAPTAISYNELYGALRSGAVTAGENEASSVEQMRFHEVAPSISLTGHAITIRPLCFSQRTFERLPVRLQDAVVQAGREAAAWGREFESRTEEDRLAKLEAQGRLRRYAFRDRDELQQLVGPVLDRHAREIGARDILETIRAA